MRCPCYVLPPSRNGVSGMRGFGLFIQQKFAGNALTQLLRLVRDRELVDAPTFAEAVERAGVSHLLL